MNLVDGVMEAYSPAYRVQVIVSLSSVNGVRVWYLYEGNCGSCGRARSCRKMLEDEADERGIELASDERGIQPTELALNIFSRYIGGASGDVEKA